MKLFFRFIRRYALCAAAFLLFAAIFACVLSLYDLHAEAVFYASALCAAAAAVIITVRFVQFRRNYLEWQRLLDETNSLISPLPEPTTPEQKQVCELIELLRRKCADAQNRYKNDKTDMLDYFTTWVHQIKIPIAVMKMDLSQNVTDEQQALSAELMRIEQYVEMVLYYFRLDENASDIVAASVSIDSVIRLCVRKYAAVFIRKRLRLDYQGTDLTATTDEKWLAFILEQLLSNSVKYTDSGSVTITVQGNSITVTDTGIGIAPEDVPRVFERGFTGYNGRAGNSSTGLGLYLVKKACKKIGAAISVQSTVGKGTSVTLTLPDKIQP